MEWLRVAANADGVVTRDMSKVKSAFLVAGSDAASASIFDADTQTGTAKITLKALANSMSPQIDLCQLFKNGVSVTLTGTAPILYIGVE